MKRSYRFRHWLAGKVLGQHSEDYEWGCDVCNEQVRVYSEPDYYTEDGIAVYDMTARLCALQAEENTAFRLMLEHGARYDVYRDGKRIDWNEDEPTPLPDRPAREPRTEPEAPSTDHR